MKEVEDGRKFGQHIPVNDYEIMS
jgi:hypothetical protein